MVERVPLDRLDLHQHVELHLGHHPPGERELEGRLLTRGVPQALLQREPGLDGIFVASDIQALGVLRTLREANILVPDDVAVVGFDDIQVSAYVGLSTLNQPMYEMGKQAITLLLERLAHPDRSVEHTEFIPRLVVRETSERHTTFSAA